MHIVEIPEADIKVYFPEHLGECSKEQYINMCRLLFKNMTDEISYEELKTHAVYYLMNMKRVDGGVIEIENKKLENVLLLSELAEGFFEKVPEENQKKIKLYFINNPIYKITAFRDYYGPSDEFNNVKFGEYVDALGYYADFNQTKELHYLKMLTATFYREKKPFYKRFGKSYMTDSRINYSSERSSMICYKLRFLNVGVFYGFYLLFASFQKYLTTAKLYVQGVEIDVSVLYKDFGLGSNFKSSLPGIGIRSIQYTLAESGIFGSLEDLRQIPLWEVFIRLYDIRKRDLDAYEQLKSNPTNVANN
ncbi:hypothetical protein [Flavicella sp.]|uniref:hypothetical protein n=1 Tax=Flavicella sp. TaxID=2957742 RepID=UPI003015DC59